jgi:hypothetical protein
MKETGYGKEVGNREEREGKYIQPAMKSPQSPHRLRLYARHSKEVLEISEVGGELG